MSFVYWKYIIPIFVIKYTSLFLIGTSNVDTTLIIMKFFEIIQGNRVLHHSQVLDQLLIHDHLAHVHGRFLSIGLNLSHQNRNHGDARVYDHALDFHVDVHDLHDHACDFHGHVRDLHGHAGDLHDHACDLHDHVDVHLHHDDAHDFLHHCVFGDCDGSDHYGNVHELLK